MSTPIANRSAALRRLAALGALGLSAVAVSASPAAAQQAHAQAGKTITLHFYSVVTGLTYTRPDGTVAAHPPQKPEAGGKLDISELAYAGSHQSHAKKWTLTSHTTCVFTAKGAPTCDGQTAIGGNQMLFFHTPAGGAPVVSGGTGRYAGATGTAAMKTVGNGNNSDVVVVVHLRK